MIVVIVSGVLKLNAIIIMFFAPLCTMKDIIFVVKNGPVEIEHNHNHVFRSSLHDGRYNFRCKEQFGQKNQSFLCFSEYDYFLCSGKTMLTVRLRSNFKIDCVAFISVTHWH